MDKDQRMYNLQGQGAVDATQTKHRAINEQAFVQRRGQRLPTTPSWITAPHEDQLTVDPLV